MPRRLNICKVGVPFAALLVLLPFAMIWVLWLFGVF